MKAFYILLILIYFCACHDPKIQRSQDPNIIFILSDDHSSQSWGIYESILKQHILNPNIKRLAREGIVLDNVFCTNSICVPNRGSIFTGQYSHQNGIYTLSDFLSPDSNNIAKVLQHSGYQTALIGKWHLKKEPAGFDDYLVLPGQGIYNNPKLKSKDNWKDGNKKDPHENKNAYSDLVYQYVITTMKVRLVELRSDIGDTDSDSQVMQDILSHHFESSHGIHPVAE